MWCKVLNIADFFCLHGNIRPGNTTTSLLFGALKLFFLLFSYFQLRSVGYIASYKLNFQNWQHWKCLIPRGPFNNMFVNHVSIITFYNLININVVCQEFIGTLKMVVNNTFFYKPKGDQQDNWFGQCSLKIDKVLHISPTCRVKVVSRSSNPQPQVGENNPYFFNFRPEICEYWCLSTHFIPNNCYWTF